MAVESNPSYPKDLDPTWPAGNESRREGDDHLRNIKKVITEYLAAEEGTIAYGSQTLLGALFPAGRVVFSFPAGVATNGLDDDIGGDYNKIGTITLDDGTTQIDVWNTTRAPNT